MTRKELEPILAEAHTVLGKWGMTPVKQTRFGKPDGNCWEACLATLTGIPLEEFGGPWRNDNDRTSHVLSVLSEHGFGSFSLDLKQREHIPTPSAPYILGGINPRNVGHVVIAAGSRVIFDPNPANDGLVGMDQISFVYERDAAGFPDLPICEHPDLSFDKDQENSNR